MVLFVDVWVCRLISVIVFAVIIILLVLEFIFVLPPLILLLLPVYLCRFHVNPFPCNGILTALLQNISSQHVMHLYICIPKYTCVYTRIYLRV